MAQYYLGFDAGGTQCRSRLVDAQGKVLGRGDGGPANARIGLEAVRSVLLETGAKAIRMAGISEADLPEIAAGAGIAGISRPGVRERLEALDFPYGSIAFETDGMIANLGAHAGADGAILIIGTGSIAHIKHEGRNFSIGGYGFDGRTKPTPLSSAVTARFSHDTSLAIAWMDEAAPGDYAQLAPLVMDFAEADDEIARSIVEDAAEHIERFIETIFRRGARQCALAGGLSQRIRPWLRERTVARLVPAKGDPLDGALYLAGYRAPGSV